MQRATKFLHEDNLDSEHSIHCPPPSPQPASLQHQATSKAWAADDASAKGNSPSNTLYECLLREPILLTDPAAVLVRSCLFPTAIIRDEETAFLHLTLDEKMVALKDPTHLPSIHNIRTTALLQLPLDKSRKLSEKKPRMATCP